MDVFDDWFAEEFKDLHRDTGGKFHIGQTVRYISLRNLRNPVLKHFIGCDFMVSAVNVHGNGDVEYMLEGFPWLVYENEICGVLGLEKTLPCNN